MANQYLMRADEIAEELDISKAFAYKIIQKLNDELAKKGYLVIHGRVSRKYFEEQIYGLSASDDQKGA